MRVLVKGENACGGGYCPTVYEDEDGSIYVQGYMVEPNTKARVTLPDGEDVVRISRELFEAIRQA